MLMDIEREIFFSKDKFLRLRLIRLSDISGKKILILSNVDISIAAKFSQKLAKPYCYIGPKKMDEFILHKRVSNR